MKRILPFAFIAAFAPSAFAQLPVSTAAQNKKVIIEEFTGIKCTYCPDGHKIANDIMKANPGKAFAINIHTGGYANGIPDMRTTFGDAIAATAGITGYPTGTVNRMGKAIDRGQWATSTKTYLGQASYVNVAFDANINSKTRELTVNVEMYFTANGASTVNLNLALLQDNIEGPQTGGSTYNPGQVLPNGKYNHIHVFRDLITGQWGEAITTTSKGTLVKKQYKYVIAADLKSIPLTLKDLHLVAFVAEGNATVITASSNPITIDQTTSINTVSDLVNQVSLYPNPSASISNVDVTLQSVGNVTLSLSNILGEVVYSTAVNNLSAGNHIFPIDVSNLNSGVYFVNLTLGNEHVTKKINVIK